MRSIALTLAVALLACACIPPQHRVSGDWEVPDAAYGSFVEQRTPVSEYIFPNGTARPDRGATEEDVVDLEEGDEAASEVFVSSAPPSPPPPVDLGGNGSLTLTRLDTGEKITARYRVKGVYNAEALKRINRLMRCSLDGSEIEIPIKLVELLDAVEDKFGKRGITLLSGYRTNELNRTIKGAAEHSLHMLGWAADIRVPGYSSTKVRNYALKKGVGGVGYYPSKGFTHLDVGRVRYWTVKRAPKRRRAVRRPARSASKKVYIRARKPAAASPAGRDKRKAVVPANETPKLSASKKRAAGT